MNANSSANESTMKMKNDYKTNANAKSSANEKSRIFNAVKPKTSSSNSDDDGMMDDSSVEVAKPKAAKSN